MEIINGYTLQKEDERFVPKRIVVKIGTSTLCEDDGIIRGEFVSSLAEQILELRGEGIQTILVSSGAVALGKLRSPDVQDVRLAAAVGQPLLMQAWNKAFYPVPALQFLFTESDLKDTEGIRHSLSEGLALGVPIINGPGSENNDAHASKIARIIGADTLVLLTNKHGVLNQEQQTVPLVRSFGEIAHLIGNGQSQGGSFGMGPKAYEASSFARTTGRSAFIAHGHQPDVLRHLVSGKHHGVTRFARP